MHISPGRMCWFAVTALLATFCVRSALAGGEACCAAVQPECVKANVSTNPPATELQAPATSGDEFVQFTPPPAAITPEETALINRAKDALKSGKIDASAVLSDSAYTPIHARTEFRMLIKDHAPRGEITICGNDEPGMRLHLTLEFVDKAGKPVADAMLYLYHTSDKGWYSDKATHIRSSSGDWDHARLFGYARTDDRGCVQVQTIRPAGYPGTDMPAHIHLSLTVKGREALVGEVRFDDDPRLTPEEKKRSGHDGGVVVLVEPQADGSQRATARFVVKP